MAKTMYYDSNLNLCLRVHCWNDNGKNKGKNCPDLEISYYIECTEQIDFEAIKNRRKRSPIVCVQNDSLNSTTDKDNHINEEITHSGDYSDDFSGDFFDEVSGDFSGDLSDDSSDDSIFS